MSPELPLWPDNPQAEDLLGFDDVATPIVAALMRDRLDPVAVGAFGDWGSGKTTILNLVRKKLTDANELEKNAGKQVVVVYTQPWEYDPSTSPKATLINEVLSALHAYAKANEKLSEAVKKRFKDLAKRVQWTKAIALAANTAISFTPPTIEKLTAVFGPEGEVKEPTLQGFRDEFADLLSQLEDVSRVVVLVDDLDRCLPPAVVSILESIKLFLSVEKMGFVLAADRRLVRHAIAEQYRSAPQAERMAEEYLEKIVQIEDVPLLVEL